MSAGDNVVAVVRKNAREEVRIGLGEYKGFQLVSLRVWADAYAGDDRIPTKAGFNLSLDKLGSLIDALRKAEAAALEAGLIERNAA